MSKDQKEICLYCKAWDFNADGFLGDVDNDPHNWQRSCRGDLPSRKGGDGPSRNRAEWPETYGSDWCCKFVERRDDHEGPEHISKVAGRVIGGIKPKSGEDAA